MVANTSHLQIQLMLPEVQNKEKIIHPLMLGLNPQRVGFESTKLKITIHS
jgi:hypothetical protein